MDGYVVHQVYAPGPSLFRHFTEQVYDLAGSVYRRELDLETLVSGAHSRCRGSKADCVDHGAAIANGRYV
jgi:hypothetical protein